MYPMQFRFDDVKDVLGMTVLVFMDKNSRKLDVTVRLPGQLQLQHREMQEQTLQASDFMR
jgi:hypothetical protein